MNLMKTFAAIAALTAMSACEVDTMSPGEAAAAATARPTATPAPATASSSGLASQAQAIATFFDNRSGDNLGDGWHFDRAFAEGNRATIEVQAPVSGRLYRNNGTASDPLYRETRRFLCRSSEIAQFLATGGEIRFIVEGYDNVRIGNYLFNRAC